MADRLGVNPGSALGQREITFVLGASISELARRLGVSRQRVYALLD